MTKLETSESTASEPEGTTAAVQLQSPEKQLGSFEAAMKLFHARDLKQARELFLQAAQGPVRDVAHRAQLHVAMCDRRLEQAAPNLRSAEDYYTYGVAQLNARNVADARAHLEQALQLAPGADHIYYALALAQALGGDLAGAHENMKRAIELEPRNRIMARQDADFAPLANEPPFDVLLYPERKGW
ncbi:MAG: tetratricopeptide repeat protein [Bryobacteraceae bacterium]|jgi:tetratricopeptide (TPR) repeat protein